MECGKKLGIIEGYRHPVMGKDFLLCTNCFDTVSTSVEKWSELISPYIGFFKNESSSSKDFLHTMQNQNDKTHLKEISNNIFFRKDIQYDIKKTDI